MAAWARAKDDRTKFIALTRKPRGGLSLMRQLELAWQAGSEREVAKMRRRL